MIASDHDWTTPPGRRPLWAPCDLEPAWISLASWITERMRIAVQAAAEPRDGSRRLACRHALARLFHELGAEIVARGLHGQVRARLDRYSLRGPARMWFSGRLDASADLMASLLWTVQATEQAVGAALDLHARARIGEPSGDLIIEEAWR